MLQISFKTDTIGTDECIVAVVTVGHSQTFHFVFPLYGCTDS